MSKARILVNGFLAGFLEKLESNRYRFSYLENYSGPPVSLTMPLKNSVYEFNQFPPFFEGLLPEGNMLEALLKKYKLDRNDYFAQLTSVGQDVVGAVTIEGLE